jgi:hypothetical protein
VVFPIKVLPVIGTYYILSPFVHIWPDSQSRATMASNHVIALFLLPSLPLDDIIAIQT